MSTTVFFDHLGGPIEPRRNTVLLTNLPPDATIQTLLDRIMICAPFGRLYSAHMHKTNPPGGSGPPVVRALVAFFTTDSAQHLINYVNGPGIVFRRCILAADWSSIRVPENGYPDHRDASRSVIVSGPKFQVNKRDIISLLENTNLMANYHNVQTRDKRSEHQVLLVFTTYTAASQAIRIIRTNRQGISAVYGRDPMEFGVTTKISSTDRNKLSINLGRW
ncbi:hypothetical protein V8F33_005976 [Rhypophila sp. PSN 637]